jgi:hypothetical protein
MAKWEDLVVPKEFRGLGIINTTKMNDYLLLKWIWKIVQREKSLWCDLLYAKYMRKNDFFSAKKGGGCKRSSIYSNGGGQ